MKKIKSIFLTILMSSLLFACNSSDNANNFNQAELGDGIFAEFKTNQGDFIIKLEHEKAPLTVANFVSLAEGTNEMVTEEDKIGKPFYDGLIFHRIIKDFMIQGGDPKGNGSGGPGYRFPDEFDPSLQHDSKGVLSMANSGPGTNGSQFFITLKETPWLNGKHTVFGKVVKGQEIVDAIGEIETAQNDRPIEDVVLEKVIIHRNGNPKLEDFEKQLKDLEKVEKEAKVAKEKVQKQNEKQFSKYFEDAEELESGVKIHYVEKNDNEKPEYQTKVGLNYAGFLTNGFLFDSNIYEVVKENNPSEKINPEDFKLMELEIDPELGLIPGFKEAILSLKYDEKAYILIPPHLAYGENGVQGLIPPNSQLVFYIEMHKAE